MTPIRQNFNTGLFAINALQQIAQQNTFSGMDSNIFGSDFSNLGSFNADLALFNAFAQGQSYNFSSMPAMSAMQMPAFNFNFSAVQMPAFNFNFGSLLTGGNIGLRQARYSASSTRAQRAVEVALSQVGVREIGSSNNGSDVNKYRNGVQNGVAWCASFVSYCYGSGQNTNNNKTFGYTASSQEIRIKAEKAGYYRKASSGYTPKVGDVVVWNYGGGKGHVGIVASVNADGSFQTVEGNCGNAVQRVTRSVSKDKIDGFVMMNEWLEA
ncbi:CHAP domain-containing protein [bacterium]|nr:CHAP domain-containing protein [bacterium]